MMMQQPIMQQPIIMQQPVQQQIFAQQPMMMQQPVMQQPMFVQQPTQMMFPDAGINIVNTGNIGRLNIGGLPIQGQCQPPQQPGDSSSLMGMCYCC